MGAEGKVVDADLGSPNPGKCAALFSTGRRRQAAFPERRLGCFLGLIKGEAGRSAQWVS